MAQQAVKRQSKTDEISAPRRRAPRLPVAPTASEPPSYERSRMTINDPEEFLSFMRAYPNPQGVTLFLYRLKPKIDLSLIGLEETNIQKGGIGDLALWGAEAIAEKFGRGQYNARVTDSNRPDGQRQVIQSCQYKLMDVEKPPVYDVRTLVLGHAENIDEVNRLIAAGMLVRDANGSPRLRTAADVSGAAAVPLAYSSVPPGDQNATSLLMQIALEAFKTSRQSPSDAVKDVIGIAQLLRPEKHDVPSIDQIAEAVVAKLGAGAARGPADPFANWERVQGFIDRAAGAAVSQVNPAGAAAPAGEGGSSWAPHVAPIISAVREFWPEVLQGLRMLRAEREPAAVDQNEGVNMERLPLLPLDQRIETIFKAGFNSMRQGVTGTQFAAWVCGEMAGGLEAFEFLKPQGAQGMLTMAAMHPQGRVVVNDAAMRPQLEKFLNEFFLFVGSAPASPA